MSHLACPLCGKYAPLSTFDPDSLDLDLQVASFRGLGRGKGFAPPERTSILGDDTYTPLVAGRVISLCEMFVKEGIIQPQDILSKDGLDEKFRSSAMYVPRVEYDLAQLSIAEYNRTLREANALIDSLSASLTTANSELEKIKAKISLEKRVDQILLRIMTKCDFKVDINEDAPWKLIVYDLDHDQLGFFLLISKSLDTTIINQLRGRLRGINFRVQLQLDTFLLYDRPKKKTLSEQLLEWTPSKL